MPKANAEAASYRCSTEEHGALDFLMQTRQLLDRDATCRSMAAMAGGCLIKLYELADLSGCKGETPTSAVLGGFLSDKAHMEKIRQKESSVAPSRRRPRRR